LHAAASSASPTTAPPSTRPWPSSPRPATSRSAADLDGIGFKTVLGGDISGCLLADEKVEQALRATADLAPAHNPPYAEGLRIFRERHPPCRVSPSSKQPSTSGFPTTRAATPCPRPGTRPASAATASTAPATNTSPSAPPSSGRGDVAAVARRLYLDGPQPVRGASLRVISCHLGGSSSVTGIRDGIAIGTSMGLSPQSGLPQSNRVGDLDSAALPCAMRRLGLTLEQAEKQLTKEGGLLGLSGTSNDLRDIRAAAQSGDTRAQLAIDTFVHSIRHWIGAFWLEMGGCDALVFTAGIGENNPWLREAVCAGLSDLGLHLDLAANASAPHESNLAAADSTTRVLVIPAHEELVVAREASRLLAARRAS
jgi:acetate kinase